MLAEVSRSVVGLHKELYGKGPTRARSYIVGDVLLCLLAGGFTRAETTLLTAGKGALVRRQREELQGIARSRFTSAIEAVTGRAVVGWLSSIDERAQLSAEVFVLEPRQVEVGLDHDGLGQLGDVARSRDGRPPS